MEVHVASARTRWSTGWPAKPKTFMRDTNAPAKTKNAEWDTFHRIERADPELLAKYPNLAKLKIIHDDADLQEGDGLAMAIMAIPPNAWRT